MTERTCGACRHWLARRCHRYPPIVTSRLGTAHDQMHRQAQLDHQFSGQGGGGGSYPITPMNMQAPVTETHWPYVAETDFCGEWAAKEQP